MARAETIWIVLSDAGAVDPVAAFTVKHELETWLSRREDRSELLIYRLPDGGSATPKVQLVSIRDLKIDKPSPWSARKGWDS